MSDVYCPKCKTLLNNDEKASGKCFNCGASFSSVLPEEKKSIQTSDSINNENTVGGILKAIGILILIIGTIGSIVIAGGDGYGYAFSFARFILPEIGTIVSGMMFLAIIGFIITTILGMIVSIKETKVLKYIVLVLAIICLMVDTAGLFMFDFALFLLLQMCTLIPSILALIASIKNVK